MVVLTNEAPPFRRAGPFGRPADAPEAKARAPPPPPATARRAPSIETVVASPSFASPRAPSPPLPTATVMDVESLSQSEATKRAPWPPAVIFAPPPPPPPASASVSMQPPAGARHSPSLSAPVAMPAPSALTRGADDDSGPNQPAEHGAHDAFVAARECAGTVVLPAEQSLATSAPAVQKPPAAHGVITPAASHVIPAAHGAH